MFQNEAALLQEIREAVRDFDFNPNEYSTLLSKYGCNESGQLYPAIRKHLAKLLGTTYQDHDLSHRRAKSGA
jgi:hypothetical protein